MDQFAEWVRHSFGLGDGPLLRTVGGRGADGDVWHLQVDSREYAVKRPFHPFDVEAVSREAALLDHLAAREVEVPTHVGTTDGRLVAEVPADLGGGRARVSHWIEGDSVGARTSELAEQLGALLAQLHRAAPATERQPRSWYTAMLAPVEWAHLVEQSAGRPWHDALAARLGDLTAYDELVRRAHPATGPFILGHCDLHPDNALVAPDGSLRALDWEDFGPLDPGRELAKTLVQWHVLDNTLDEEAITRTVTAYRAAGGPGVLADLRDFAMVLCSETNFLASQIRLALDDAAQPERREQAQGEITEALGAYLPSLATLDRVLDAATA
ncbi:hypothetical protein N802_19095 [Knoellia sinensis KCTC 19936]|uniref:Aminoglycoside phosphotransferase domain-containing protein n=1 Tax=Knoellia sinensis KCTC 19936 TaxID=1385520 RepID=A0A0A0J443_9MICO|nr:phosphotransferase [Knoellia sinensis]KGN31953.1 hypothetical protein N802_19095 [Knoellia sinensis KCTC 19936]